MDTLIAIGALLLLALPYVIVHMSLNDGHLINKRDRLRRLESQKQDTWFTQSPEHRNRRTRC